MGRVAVEYNAVPGFALKQDATSVAGKDNAGCAAVCTAGLLRPDFVGRATDLELLQNRHANHTATIPKISHVCGLWMH